LFVIIIFQLSFLTGSASVYDFNVTCRNAYSATMALNFDQALQLIDKEKKINPHNLIPAYIELKLYFLKTFITEEQQYYESFKRTKTDLLNQIKSGDEDLSPYPLMLKSEASFTHAVLKVKFNEMMGAGIEFRKSYKLIELNMIKYPQFIQNKKTAGVIYTLIGAVPKNYQWLISFLGFKGSIEKGLSELENLQLICKTDNALHYLNDELLFLNSFLSTHLANDPAKAMQWTEAMRGSANPLLLFATASILSNIGKNDKLIELLTGRTTVPGKFKVPYLEYMLGTALLNKADPSALVYFGNYLREFRGTSFIRASLLKAGWSELLQGDTVAYHQRMKEIINARGDLTDEDKQALTEARSGLIPNPSLLKSRLLFDGGYYPEAFKILAYVKTTELTKLKDQVEYLYRLARVYDRLSDHEKAKRHYMEVIRLSRNKTWYFAANSALLLGQLYERENQLEKAAYYYNQCLDMNGHEYQNSIDQKAQTGLNRVQNL